MVDVNPAGFATLVNVEIFEVPGGTRVEFRQTGLASGASRDPHIGGWCDPLDALFVLIVEGAF